MNTTYLITGIISNVVSVLVALPTLYMIRMWYKDKAKEALKRL